MFSKIKSLREQTVRKIKTFQSMRERVRFWRRASHRRTLLVQMATFNTRLDNMLNLSTHTIADLNQVSNMRNIYRYEVVGSGKRFTLREKWVLAVRSAYNLLQAGEDAFLGNPTYSHLLLHRYPSILALGILLLEIETGHPLDNKHIPNDLNPNEPVNINTHFAIARSLFTQVEEIFYCSYSGVIRACLNIDWLPLGEDPELRRSSCATLLYENVVGPLELLLYSGFGIRIGDLARERFRQRIM